jgi:large subunit ribosomal protein L3
MGCDRITQPGLKVIEVDEGRNLLIVKGAVPGAPGGLLRIEKSNR